MTHWQVRFVVALTVIILFSLTAGIAWASDISQALYVGTVRVHNDNVTATAVSTNMTLATQNLIDRGYMLSNATNTDMRTQLGFDTPYMPATGNGTIWAIWVPSINGYTQLDYKLYMGGAPNMASKLAWFPGTNGMLTVDNATLELGNNFAKIYSGYINTAVTDNLTDKPSAFQVATGSGNITASIYGTAANVTVSLPAAERVLKVWADGTNLYIGEATNTPPPPSSYSHLAVGFAVNSEFLVGFATSGNATHVLLGGFTNQGQWSILGQVPLGGASVPNTSSNITECRAGSIPYVYYTETYVNSSLVQHIQWENNATVFHNTATAYDNATPTFLTNSNNANVWAELIDFKPIKTATSSPTNIQPPNVVSGPTQPTGMYTELNVTFPGADFINSILDGATIPRALFWFPFFMLFVMLISFLVFWGTRSLIMKAVILWLCFLMVAALGGWGWWILIPFAIEEAGAIVAMKKIGW